MVNITSAAHAAVDAYSAAIALGGNYSYPLPRLASQISSFFLPNYTSFSLGERSVSQNQSVVAENFISLYTEWREEGPGTHVQIEDSRVEVVSDQSAICWLTYHISPTDECEGWNWTNVYGFRLVDGGLENGLQGGWEFAIGDNEHEQYAKRFSAG
jgi:hypothetical protein